MSSGNQYEKLFKLWATVSKLVIDGKRDVHRVAKMLQSIVDESGKVERVDLTKVELYLHDKQKKNDSWIRGYVLEKHLEKTGLIDRCLSLEDVRPWIDHPENYPEEFKGKVVLLWKSVRDRLGGRDCACLTWRDNMVVAGWQWVSFGLDSLNPTVIASS